MTNSCFRNKSWKCFCLWPHVRAICFLYCMRQRLKTKLCWMACYHYISFVLMQASFASWKWKIRSADFTNVYKSSGCFTLECESLAKNDDDRKKLTNCCDMFDFLICFRLKPVWRRTPTRVIPIKFSFVWCIKFSHEFKSFPLQTKTVHQMKAHEFTSRFIANAFSTFFPLYLLPGKSLASFDLLHCKRAIKT